MAPMDGTVILDLTHMLSGPYCGMVLADLGAQTIKIEPPTTGEATRALLANDPDHSIDGNGAYFLTLNRNKRSVGINLKSEKGLEIFYSLVKQADIVLDNFGPGVTKRLKIDHATLATINPAIISCSITGFGHEGPGANRTAFDLVAQGLGGGMSITGEPGGRALRAGIPIGDLGAGLFGVIGILAALRARDQSGVGSFVDISMLDCQISLLNYMATMYLMSGRQPAAAGNSHFVHIPYDTFPTKTRDLILTVLTDEQWHAAATVLGIPELLDEKYASQAGRRRNEQRLLERLRTRLLEDSCEDWLERFEKARVPCAPVNNFEHALKDAQVLMRQMVVDVALNDGATVRMPGNPVKISGMDPQKYSHPPALGEDTDHVLSRMAGLDQNEIDELRLSGIVS
jgi:crotonobetainyl-CoA:carnitine CoA-transferase CaiB-like acyl-CoA transferase